MESKLNIKDDDLEKTKESLDRNSRLRSDSGNIDYSDTLTSFIYSLLRDHIPAGILESIVRGVINEPEVRMYSNGFLAKYANNLADELKNAKTKILKRSLESAFMEKEHKIEMEEPKISESLDDYKEELQELKKVADDAVESMDENEASEAKIKLVEKESEPTNVVKEQIKVSLDALEYLKDYVPSENVKTLVSIIKAEVDAELTDVFKNELTRETILKERAEENKEHVATNPEAERLAKEYIEDQMSDLDEVVDVEDEDGPVSRGTLKDVKSGMALPEALDNVFNQEEENV